MSRATKIFEAHLHTVQLSDDPEILEFQKAIFPCLAEAVQGKPAPLLESPSQLDSKKLQELFQAVAKATSMSAKASQAVKGIPGGTQQAGMKLKQMMQSMKSKMGPVKDAPEKIQKMLSRTLATLSSTKGSEMLSKRLKKAVSNSERIEPKLVLATLATVTANADKPEMFPAMMDMVATMDEDEHIENFGPAIEPENEPYVEPKDDPVMDDFDMGRAALRNASKLLTTEKAQKFVAALSNILDKAEENPKLAGMIREPLERIAYSKDVGEIKAAIKNVRNARVTESASLKQILGWG